MDKKTRIQKAQIKAMESPDYILEVSHAPDFIEVIGSEGGRTVSSGRGNTVIE